MELQETMKRLVISAQGMYKNGITDHSHLYHAMAGEFDLYDETDEAPIWLSRVIAGVIRDCEEGSMTI